MIVDAHQDLAWNMLTFTRDYTRSIQETRELEEGTPTVEHNGHTLLGWPNWIEGDVGWVFATLYASPEKRRYGQWDVISYRDVEEAYGQYWRQLDVYHRMLDEHEDKFRLIDSSEALDDHRAAWQADQRRLGLTLLMEGAEGIRRPQELPQWYERGLRIIGPAWDRTRYVGSAYEPGPWSAEGLELMEVMGDLGMILDISHLSEEAALMACDRYPGVLIASHANPRWLMPNARYPERFLGRRTVERLVERDGVVGIVLANKFLVDGWQPGDRRELVSIDDVAAHIDAICQLVGDAAHVGLGSDFDGGFGLDQAPTGLDGVHELKSIGPALAQRGYSSSDVGAILGGNWQRVVGPALG